MWDPGDQRGVCTATGCAGAVGGRADRGSWVMLNPLLTLPQALCKVREGDFRDATGYFLTSPK